MVNHCHWTYLSHTHPCGCTIGAYLFLIKAICIYIYIYLPLLQTDREKMDNWYLDWFWVALFWCRVSLRVPFTNILMACYFIMMVTTITEIFIAILFWTTHFGFLWLVIWFCNYPPPGYFCSWALSDYWIEHVTFGLLYATSRFSTRILYWEVPAFAIDFVLVLLGVVNQSLASCMLVHLLEV